MEATTERSTRIQHTDSEELRHLLHHLGEFPVGPAHELAVLEPGTVREESIPGQVLEQDQVGRLAQPRSNCFAQAPNIPGYQATQAAHANPDVCEHALQSKSS